MEISRFCGDSISGVEIPWILVEFPELGIPWVLQRFPGLSEDSLVLVEIPCAE